MADRMMASRMAQRAIELIQINTRARVIGIIDNKITDVNIVEALDMPRKPVSKTYKLAEILAL